MFFGERNNQILKFERGDENIIIMYDFGINVGDTIVQNSVSNDILIAYNIDSIKLEDNTNRKRIFLRREFDFSHLDPIILIEGIGSVITPFLKHFYYDFVDVIEELQCFFVANNKVYSIDNECTKTSVIENNTNQLIIYPNLYKRTHFDKDAITNRKSNSL